MNQDTKNKCMICGDIKSNWHYGAIICEACKVSYFFLCFIYYYHKKNILMQIY